jgi:hypothetical protein
VSGLERSQDEAIGIVPEPGQPGIPMQHVFPGACHFKGFYALRLFQLNIFQQGAVFQVPDLEIGEGLGYEHLDIGSHFHQMIDYDAVQAFQTEDGLLGVNSVEVDLLVIAEPDGGAPIMEMQVSEAELISDEYLPGHLLIGHMVNPNDHIDGASGHPHSPRVKAHTGDAGGLGHLMVEVGLGDIGQFVDYQVIVYREQEVLALLVCQHYGVAVLVAVLDFAAGQELVAAL